MLVASVAQSAESATKVLQKKKCKNLYCVNRVKVLESATAFGDAVQMVRRNMVSIVCRVLGILGQSRDKKLIMYTSPSFINSYRIVLILFSLSL